ncbi:MAG TPA: isocitrate/isopropylmalate family dehydrogenase [Holophaga sp.]|nr:isocitrate/isopropylmalate family dehydrogenase [Holophaga sp.]
MFRLALIPGDGIGPEVMEGVPPLLAWARARGRTLEWSTFPFGAEHFLRTGEALSEEHCIELRDGYDAILFGAVGDPRIPDGRHAERLLLRLRQALELHVNHRPCAPFLDAHVPIKGVRASEVRIDVFRENTEGAYCLQGTSGPDRGVDEAIHTTKAVRILLEAAFTWASEHRRPLVLAHKANVMKHGHGLWMRVFQEVRARFPDVDAKGMHADALLCALVQDPKAFGVIAADNFIGDLVSDLLAAFQGGMGMAASACWAPHRPYRCSALYEPVHGSAPDIAGKGLANPFGMMLSTALLFRRQGWAEEADAVEALILEALEGGACTPDTGGTMSCKAAQAHLLAGL